MSDIKIEDDYLTSYELNILNDSILHHTFPWHLNRVVNSNNLMCDDIDNHQFCHHFIDYDVNSPFQQQSNWTQLLNPILRHINFISWKRIKANLNPRNSSIIKHGFHQDHHSQDLKVSIFYLNTNNGYTEFADGTRIESIANRLVTFPGNLRHTGTTCTDQPFRMVINFNYF